MPPKRPNTSAPPGYGIPVYDAATQFFTMSLQTGGFVTEDVFVQFFREEFPHIPPAQLRQVYQRQLRYWTPIAIAIRDGDYAYLESIVGPVPEGWDPSHIGQTTQPSSSIEEAVALVGTIIDDVIDLVFVPPPPADGGEGKQAQNAMGGMLRRRQWPHDDPAPQYYYQWPLP
jgi:hypothetical protein